MIKKVPQKYMDRINQLREEYSSFTPDVDDIIESLKRVARFSPKLFDNHYEMYKRGLEKRKCRTT